MSTEGLTVIGIDEAGRGPLIGDMVVAAVFLKSRDLHLLDELGARDSKKLTRAKRSKLAKEFLKIPAAGFLTALIPPWRIDLENLNALTLKAMVALLHTYAAILWDGSPVEVYIDEVKGVGKRAEDEAKKAFGSKLARFVMEPAADEKYRVVSMASIIAKTMRDASLRPARELFGDFGSGYASDKRTIDWIVANSGLRRPPLLVRTKWETVLRAAPGWRSARSPTILDFLRGERRGH